MTYPVTLISTCSIKDLPAFIAFQGFILRYIKAAAYNVIVPDKHYDIFTFFAKGFIVKRESEILSRLDLESIRDQLPKKLPFGWYLQQFLKLSSVFSLPAHHFFIIWDIDTCPLEPLLFFDKFSNPILTTSCERHPPYMNFLKIIYDLPQLPEQKISYISQYFAGSTNVSHTLLSHLLSKNPKSWLCPILEAIQKVDGIQRFSEYELLGYHYLNYTQQHICLSNYNWLRSGGSLYLNPISLLIHSSYISSKLSKEHCLSYYTVERRDYLLWNKYLDHLFTVFLISSSLVYSFLKRFKSHLFGH